MKRNQSLIYSYVYQDPPKLLKETVEFQHVSIRALCYAAGFFIRIIKNKIPLYNSIIHV